MSSIARNFRRLFILMASRSRELSGQAYSLGLANLSVELDRSGHSLHMLSLDQLPSRESPAYFSEFSAPLTDHAIVHFVPSGK